ncbi:MAG: hypothetical protein M3R32_02370 [Chloroflexota bacterium]|nr:hypothetical protein [Chloroflexota bacterium]
MPRASRRIAILAAASALGLLVLAPAALPARLLAADRGLVVIAQTRYQALPDQRRVHVTVDAVATSYTPNPPDGLAFYPDASFTLQAGATNVTASSGTEQLPVEVGASDLNFVSVKVTLGDGVSFEESYPYRVEYDLPDPGGAPDRNLRISPSIVAFPIWAFGSSGEPGSSVTVVLPAGFQPRVQGDPFATSTGPAGELVLSDTSLPDPVAFFAYLSADRPGAYKDTLLTVQVGGGAAALKIRAWQDDPDWGRTMGALLTAGLPALRQLIGLPYPAPDVLVVEEAATSRLGEYAGVYNKATGTIRVRYDADAYVGLHEAAHLWFNGDLFPDRWIGEAYAEFYGVQAAKAIGASGKAFDLTDDLLASKIALNDWGEIGVNDTGVEAYAYAATYHLATLIFAQTDVAHLQAVWRAAKDDEMAYQAANRQGAPEIGVVKVEGWQELLDLLDERTAVSFDDVWTEWVVNAQEKLLMVDRTAAREHYAAVVGEAGAWNLPTDLRQAMGAWHFPEAQADMALADAVLAARDQIVAQAAALGLAPPAALKQRFEEKGGLAAAKQEAGLQVEVLSAISKAAERLNEKQSFLEWIGLVGSDPRAELAAARKDFQADHLSGAATEARRALATQQDAAEAGQTRALLGGGGLLAVTGGAVVGVRIWRRRPRPESPEPALRPLDPPA